jgi:predicted nuclease of predicted toxin-antitoxin system
MRFLANENFPGEGVAALVTAGHDVDWVRVSAPGMSDEEVLGWAVRDGRVLLTFDKDFRELAWHRGLPASCGIVLFRIPMPPVNVGGLLAARIAERNDWSGHFSVVEPSRIRMRPLSHP